jgi:hypothetical protein
MDRTSHFKSHTSHITRNTYERVVGARDAVKNLPFEGGEAGELRRERRDVVAAGYHHVIVAACEAATLRVACSDKDPSISSESYRLHSGFECDVRQQAKREGVRPEVLQHLRVVGVVWHAAVEWEVRETVVVLADLRWT